MDGSERISVDRGGLKATTNTGVGDEQVNCGNPPSDTKDPGYCAPTASREALLDIARDGGGTRTRTGDDGFAIRCLSHLAMPPLEGQE